MWRKRFALLLLGGLSAALLLGDAPRRSPPAAQPPAAQPVTDEVKRTMTPGEAIALALADAEQLDPITAAQTRYLWLGPQGTALDAKTAAIALNVLSRSPVLKRPEVLANGNLVRVYLPDYAPRARDLKDWLKFWEDLQFDPAFNLLLTRDTLESAARTLLVGIKIPEVEKNVDVVRVNGPHIDAQAFVQLQLRTASQAPVVTLPYFLLRGTTTIKDKGLFATVYGGRYYEFAGVRKVKDVFDNAGKATDLDLFLADRGIGSIEQGVKAAQVFDKLRSDQRVAMKRSGVTGKPRRVDWFHGPDARDGTGSISVTHDFQDEDIDLSNSPFMNLLDVKAKAFEAIAEKSNGTHIYALFDDKEALLDEAANKVASDRTIPAPNSPRLQGALSCIACHEAAGDDGWKPLHNDVARIVNGKTRLDIITDLSDVQRLGPDVIDRLKSLYGGNFDKLIRRARDDYAETILRAAGPWPASNVTGQADVTKVAMAHLVARTRTYQYDLVTPKQALAELGFATGEGQEVKALQALLPPEAGAQIGGFVLEDERIASLKEGVAIPRADWDLVYSFAAVRSIAAARKKLEKNHAK